MIQECLNSFRKSRKLLWKNLSTYVANNVQNNVLYEKEMFSFQRMTFHKSVKKICSFCYFGSITKLHLRRNKLKQNRGTCLKKEANKIKFNQTWRFYTYANLLGIIKRFNTLKINNLRCHCHTSYD